MSQYIRSYGGVHTWNTTKRGFASNRNFRVSYHVLQNSDWEKFRFWSPYQLAWNYIYFSILKRYWSRKGFFSPLAALPARPLQQQKGHIGLAAKPGGSLCSHRVAIARRLLQLLPITSVLMCSTHRPKDRREQLPVAVIVLWRSTVVVQRQTRSNFEYKPRRNQLQTADYRSLGPLSSRDKNLSAKASTISQIVKGRRAWGSCSLE